MSIHVITVNEHIQLLNCYQLGCEEPDRRFPMIYHANYQEVQLSTDPAD